MIETNKPKEKNITLVLTHQCNLRCTYCYEKHKDNLKMSVELAKEIIDREMSMDDGVEFVEFGLFGGEPLLEFDTVVTLVEYAKTRKYSKGFIFFITTNGVLLNEERKKWLKENTDYLQMGLSLDGTKEMHDTNRGKCFDKLDLAFFRDTYPEQSVKMTISRETLPKLAEGVIFAHEQGFLVSCNLAYGIDWSAEENCKIYERQLFALMQYYLEHPEVEPCALLDINRVKSLSYTDKITVRYCGAGYAMRAYDFDGRSYPCQNFLPISIGEEMAAASNLIDFSSHIIDVAKLEKECQSCIIRNICPTCYGENYASTGDIYRHDRNMCKLFKIQFKAIAYFISLLFERGKFEGKDKAETAALLKAALMIDNELAL